MGPPAIPVPNASNSSNLTKAPEKPTTRPMPNIEHSAATEVSNKTLAGTKKLHVLDTLGFVIGGKIVINPEGDTEEVNVIAGFGSMILESPLKHDHFKGEIVLQIDIPEEEPAAQTGIMPATVAAMCFALLTICGSVCFVVGF